MADTKISDLVAQTGVDIAGDDELVMVNTSESQTKRLRFDQFLLWVGNIVSFNLREFLRVGTTGTPSPTNRGVEVHSDETESAIRVSNDVTTPIGVARFYNPNGIIGSIITSGSSTSYNTSSDYRLKENAVVVTDACARLDGLPVYDFNFKADPNAKMAGFFAHELAEVIPEAVTGVKDELDENGDPVYQAVDQSKVTPLLVAAVKELMEEVDALKLRVSALEGLNV